MGHQAISIEERIKKSFIRMLLILVVSLLTNMVSSYSLSFRYNQLITNVEFANDLKDLVVNEINIETWQIVSGMTDFDEGKQYEKINDIYNGIAYLKNNTTLPAGNTQLEVARRTTDTLLSYVNQLGKEVEEGASVDRTVKTHEEIKNVSVLVGDVLQEFIFYEVRNAAILNQNMIRTQNVILMVDFMVILVFSLYLIRSMKRLTKSINVPLNELEQMAGRIARGDFDVRVGQFGVLELRSLTESLNTMASRIKALIEENDREHDNLKKAELNLLQAQIKPHFLYNTYDTIIWLAEKNSMDDVIKVVESLTVFYRVALSKGNEWIRVCDEVKHVESYLVIQHFRYGNILDYSIEIDEGIHEVKVLKLLLQPVVENAIYHGIKYLRSKGTIRIRGFVDDSDIYFVVEDTGVGMDKAVLRTLKSQMYENVHDREDYGAGQRQRGFGLRNVHQRIQLYYGENSGLSIDSCKGEGTKVTLKLGSAKSKRIVEVKNV